MRLSPDGRTIVFIGVLGAVQQLFKRRLQDWEATAMPGTEGAQALFFSPNGKWVGFWAAGHFKKAPIDGGPPVEIGEIARADHVELWGATWGPTDDILFSTPRLNGIWRISATGGGTPEQIVRPGVIRDRWYLAPHALLNGRGVLFTVSGATRDGHAELLVHDFANGEQRTLQRDAADGRYLPSGHLLFMRRGTLMAAPFDAERLVLTGEPVAVLGDVMQARRHRNNGDETWAGQYDVANGTLAFLTGGIHPPGRSELVLCRSPRRRDAAESWAGFLPRAAAVPETGSTSRISRRTITERRMSGSTTSSRRLRGGSPSTEGCWPIWSPDGRTLLYSRRGQLRTIAADGNGVPVEIPRNATTEDVWMVPCSWVGANATAVSLNGPGIWLLRDGRNRYSHTVSPARPHARLSRSISGRALDRVLVMGDRRRRRMGSAQRAERGENPRLDEGLEQRLGREQPEVDSGWQRAHLRPAQRA